MYREVVSVLPPGGRRFLNAYQWALASLAVFDIAALGLLAAVVAPAAAGQPVTLPVIGELDSIGILWMLVAVCALMIAKGVFAVGVTWWATRRIPKYEVAIGDRLFRAYLAAPWRDRLRKNSTDIMRFTDSGVDSTTNSFLLPGATLLAELVSLVAVIGTLAVIQPIVALTTLVYMLAVGAILFFWIARHARLAGEINVRYSIRTSRLILEVIAALKEVTLRKKENEVADLVRTARSYSARARANTNFLQQLPRFALEAALVGGFVLIGGVGFAIGGISEAIAAVALFALAGFRVAPSVIRSQSVLSNMVAASSYVRHVLDELKAAEAGGAEAQAPSTAPMPEAPRELDFTSVSFAYDDPSSPAVSEVTIKIPFGESIAFVGASGSGKSTMVDLVLGLLEPTSGSITIDSLPLPSLRGAWRSRVGYVPQEVSLFDGTIAQNVGLTWADDLVEDKVRVCLEKVGLLSDIEARPGGIHGLVGERGMALSGGQRQRLGIARALYTDPLVLVMDESTSSLDTQTEAQVTEAINAIEGGITKIVVAHRLATIRDFDRIFFMSNGRVVSEGRFDELVSEVPEFARQAFLAGLA